MQTVIIGLPDVDAKGTKPTATSTPLVKKPWLWVGLAAPAVTVVIIAVIVTKRRRGRNRKRDKNTRENVIQMKQMVPLVPPTGRNERGELDDVFDTAIPLPRPDATASFRNSGGLSRFLVSVCGYIRIYLAVYGPENKGGFGLEKKREPFVV